ncbi:hypothetical protein L2E82_02638 [Cichorium intybus]|uniref:Uncharacterized protein n=1 Tax=Cichorium intybus TaxID=13427 RepID=A0ACB9H1U0_CICIN|nr:hypothetical protein L2E82_02638 [Cichorium intybus]
MIQTLIISSIPSPKRILYKCLKINTSRDVNLFLEGYHVYSFGFAPSIIDETYHIKPILYGKMALNTHISLKVFAIFTTRE